MKSGWPLAALPTAKGVKTTQGFATLSKARLWLARSVIERRSGGSAYSGLADPAQKIPVADPVSSRSTGAGGTILSKPEDREPRS
jgi:hypothetical protein